MGPQEITENEKNVSEQYNNVRNTGNMVSINTKHKDRLFCRLFGSEEHKKDLLELYNALNHTEYADPSELELYTMEDVVYMRMKNDVACMIHGTLSLMEHQSTINPNMPFRGFMYFARMYETYKERVQLNVFSKRLQKLPTPQYYVFYNGKEPMEDRTVLRMSDAFEKPLLDGGYEWTAVVLNINDGHNKALMNACSMLYQYSKFIAKIRKYKEAGMSAEAAVDQAVYWSIENNVLKDYLNRHRAEVKDMMLTEYNEQDTMQAFREEGIEEGIEKGRVNDIRGMLKAGRTPEQIADFCGFDLEEVKAVQKDMLVTV